MKFFRQQYLKKGSGSSFDAPNPTEPYSTRPPITRGHTYDADTREAKEEFIIPELSKEPTKGQLQLHEQGWWTQLAPPPFPQANTARSGP